MTQVPAGWYPDPEAPPGYAPAPRWWDGQQWTEHRQSQPGPARPAGPTTADGQPLAGWWPRVLASFLDWLLLVVVTYAVTLPVRLDVQEDVSRLDAEFQQRLAAGEPGALGDYFRELTDIYYSDHLVSLILFPVLLTIAYHAGLLRSRGATLGKLVCGLRVRLRGRDGRLPWRAVGARVGVQFLAGTLVAISVELTGSFTWLAITGLGLAAFYLADALAALGSRRQTIHDRAAGTVVVKTR